MRKRRFGIVVNTSSGAGLEGRESMGAYAPTKAAMDGECFFPQAEQLLEAENSQACPRSLQRK